MTAGFDYPHRIPTDHVPGPPVATPPSDPTWGSKGRSRQPQTGTATASGRATASAARVDRTIVTGHDACSTQCRPTEPSMALLMAPRPRWPITSTSAPSAASSRTRPAAPARASTDTSTRAASPGRAATTVPGLSVDSGPAAAADAEQHAELALRHLERGAVRLALIPPTGLE